MNKKGTVSNIDGIISVDANQWLGFYWIGVKRYHAGLGKDAENIPIQMLMEPQYRTADICNAAFNGPITNYSLLMYLA